MLKIKWIKLKNRKSVEKINEITTYLFEKINKTD